MMEIRVYVGPHKTASKHLASVLYNNAELLDMENTVFHSSPRNTLRHINSALKAIATGGDKADITDQMMHALTYGRDVKRLLLVNPNIVGNVVHPFGKELFYPRTTGLIHQLQSLFDRHSLQFFASTRNPATFLPSCYAQSLLAATFSSYNDFLAEVNVTSLKWSPFLQRLQGKQNDIPLTVWRFEDYPYIWRDVAQIFSGIRNSQVLRGNSTRINSSLTLKGAHLLNKYIEENPPRTREDFENTKQTFLKKFPSSSTEIAGPEWPPELVQELIHNYEDDWYYIERMDGVETIQPRRFG
jgi:hypothetical protein